MIPHSPAAATPFTVADSLALGQLDEATAAVVQRAMAAAYRMGFEEAVNSLPFPIEGFNLHPPEAHYILLSLGRLYA